MPDRSPRPSDQSKSGKSAKSGKSGQHNPAKAPTTDPRQLAFETLCEIAKKDAYADVALDRHLVKSKLANRDRALATELVYGCVRRRRTLDAMIDRLAKKPADQQPPDLRVVLHLGLYQLVYSDRIPTSAAVDTTVELAKRNRLSGLSGLVNGILRQYLRIYGETAPNFDDITEPIAQLATRTSFPDWMVAEWVEQLGWDEAELLCYLFDRAPQMHLRVNRRATTRDEILAQFAASEIDAEPIAGLPDGIRLISGAGRIVQFPSYGDGLWSIQDGSAQLVTYLLDPQPGEVIVDACAAPGGKATHAAELMDDRGTIWACDRTASRLKKVASNGARLNLASINALAGDSREQPQFVGQCDRVLVDAPCSGLGTLHRRADLRWRQTRENAIELATLQGELLDSAATWLKPNGVLVYATCSIHGPENEGVIEAFLERHSDWAIVPPPEGNPVRAFWNPAANPQGWLKLWPHRSGMDGFFMVRLERRSVNVAIAVQ
jgi:16S rRNA (cytosine967-C5)-methyltransferase